ncbi:recombinase family protein [Naumannella halotolerans]|uniref:Recombinase n=1 Tax=Naumannella halotolerans TaxID=993414 RepID=A0A4R7J253_9ACTN|nr:recombinase family protein [Naumannella halotolerans]TDT31085.1 recombinase [Naumannella halotolerans]
MSVLAGIYLRISQDRTGDAAGVGRQEQMCRAKAAELGWTIVDVYSDNDISAYSGVTRPAYERMLDDLRTGRINGIAVYDLDRLYRRPIELEHLIDLADKHRVALASVAGEVDLATDSGRLYARIKGAVARGESEAKARRQRDANRSRALQGAVQASVRPFGWEPGGKHLRPAEADALRDAAQWMIDGLSMAEVARRWNAAGWRTTLKGNEYTTDIVRQVLTNPRLVGWRTYHGQVLYGDDGAPIRGQWEPVLDEDTWTALQAVLQDPSRKKTWVAGPKLLLAGVAVCGDCGANIASGGLRNGHQRRYRCGKMRGHVYRHAAPVDVFVRDTLIARLSEPGVGAGLQRTEEVDVPAVRAEAASLRRKQDALAEAFAEGQITMEQLRAGTGRLKEKIVNLEERLRVRRRSAASIRLLTADDVASVWDGMTLAQQRIVLGELCTVRMYAPGQGIRHVTDEHVQMEWR